MRAKTIKSLYTQGLILAISLMTCCLPQKTIAQSGANDPTFNPQDGANANVLACVTQPDGKILIAGEFTSFNGMAQNYLARLNPDGSLDNTFNIGSGANSAVFKIALQNDGKILIAGFFTSFNQISRGRIARLNEDGSLDNTFDPVTGANAAIHTISIQPDGKIVIGGAFTSYNGTNRARIARLNADGSLDSAFNPGAGAMGIVHASLLLDDGKLIIGGGICTVQ